MTTKTVRMPAKSMWGSELDCRHYDRKAKLSSVERKELEYLLTHHVGPSAGSWPVRLRVGLKRFTQPIHDACSVLDISAQQRAYATRIILREVDHRQKSFWSWTDAEWIETIGATMPDFIARHPANSRTTRQPVFGLAYLLARFTAFERFAMHSIELTSLARTVFGEKAMSAALGRIMHVLLSWGYKPSIQGKLHTALAYALLSNRSPRLESLTLEGLSRLYSIRSTKYGIDQLYPLSRALAHLKMIPVPLPNRHPNLALMDRLDTAGIASEWVNWCIAWHAQAVMSPRVKKQGLHGLLQIGRWLAANHPDITSPEQWDYGLAADFVSAVDQMRVGDWSRSATQDSLQPSFGKPIMPRTKAGLLSKARKFFLDLQETPHRVGSARQVRTLQRRFNPMRALRTPRPIRFLIAPDPRVIDDQWWLKLIRAAETLTASDLRRFQLAMYPFELVRAVAVTWCLSGLRSDEIRRLRVGCIGKRDDADATLPEDAVCFLRVPVNKTGTAFTKPVHRFVGQRIEEWERVRPPQASALDGKTNELVDYLFAFRHRQIGPNYINKRVIPLLCAKANVPAIDSRGRITSHRARATVASALYNAPEGLSISELGEWLGHKDPRSTRHYAALQPTRLAKAVGRANRNSRLAHVLLDPVAAGRGEPALFYALGDGNYCANPAWSACPHRMACLKCPMYVPKSAAQRIEARAGIVHLLQQVPLTNEEKAIAEGDIAALSRYIDSRKEVPTPAVPDKRYVFNPSDDVPAVGQENKTSDN